MCFSGTPTVWTGSAKSRRFPGQQRTYAVQRTEFCSRPRHRYILASGAVLQHLPFHHKRYVATELVNETSRRSEIIREDPGHRGHLVASSSMFFRFADREFCYLENRDSPKGFHEKVSSTSHHHFTIIRELIFLYYT